MNTDLSEKLEQAIWVGKSLFDRNKVSGSSANMSFVHGDVIYITRSGSCFGNLTRQDFAQIDPDGKMLDEKIPSKEFPLHIIYYKNKISTQAVIHTHSVHSTLWSMLKHNDQIDIMPTYTPYLRMKLGRIGLVEYYPPGSEDLFQAFETHIHDADGFILKNHGPILGGKTIMDAFHILEELEESAKIAWALKDMNIPTI